jgi:hypothetical protein
MNNFDEQKYNSARSVGERFFDNNRIIHSACLGEVHINSEGFMHLIFKNNRHKRDWKNQTKRFHLLQYVKPVLDGMKFYQEYYEKLGKIEEEHKGKTGFNFKLIKYWGFVAVINNRIRIKIILKRIGDGKIIFWSIIPSWKTKEYKDIKFTILHKGDPDED